MLEGRGVIRRCTARFAIGRASEVIVVCRVLLFVPAVPSAYNYSSNVPLRLTANFAKASAVLFGVGRVRLRYRDVCAMPHTPMR